MKKRWVITFLTAALVVGGLAGKYVQAAKKKAVAAADVKTEEKESAKATDVQAAKNEIPEAGDGQTEKQAAASTAQTHDEDEEAAVQGFQVFSYDSDDKKFMALCNTILQAYPNLYGDDQFDAAIPVPYVVYEQKLDDHKTGQWGTFASFNFNYNPDTLLMEMVSGGYDRGIIILEEKDGDYLGDWTPTYTDDDQLALEKEYGVSEEMDKLRYDNDKVTEKMVEILKGYCEFNGYRTIGYKDVDGSVHEFDQ